MIEQGFSTRPDSIPLGEMEVYAEVQFDQASECWQVVVIFSRAPDLPPLQGQDVDAHLVDARDVSLEVVERPKKVLVEVGGGLGNSVNAPFRFRASGAAPARLSVTYLGRTVQFQVVPRETNV
jgi:hypothetical protein